MKTLGLSFGITLLGFATSISSLYGASVTPGDILVYRVGDGSAALGTTATAVFLDEYSVAGSLVQSFAMPTTGSGSLTAVGNATTEGGVSLAQDGSRIVFTGYRKDVGGSNPSSDAPATTSRVIGTLNLSGTFDTSIGLTDPTGTIRSAATTDGSLFYIGTSAAVRYVGSPSGASTSTQIDARNSRQVKVSGNVLFASNGSTSITGKVQTYGNLPTGATAPTPVVTLATADAVNGFALFDLNSSVAGADTLYALSTVEGLLRKYTFDGTTWTASGSLSTSAANLTGFADGNHVVSLFLTTGSSLISLTDNSGYGNSLTGSFTTIATAPSNEGFRGLDMWAPIPEPGTFALAGLGVLGVIFLRRSRHS